MSQEVLWVNTQLKGPRIKEFMDLKHRLGIETNSDVVRCLIRQAARAPVTLTDLSHPYDPDAPAPGFVQRDGVYVAVDAEED